MNRTKRHKKGRSNRGRIENTTCTASTSATAIDVTHAVPASSDEEYDDQVDPWTARSKSDSGFDYDEIIKVGASFELSGLFHDLKPHGKQNKESISTEERLRCEKVDNQLIAKIEKITGRPVHYLISRNIACSHRDMYEIMKLFKPGRTRGKKDDFFLYTGRGPSSKAMHLGHAIPFLLTKWLQDTFGVSVVIQITDDEKFLWRDIQLEEAISMAHENIKDIIAFGFDPKKTFIFTDIEYMCPEFYKNICRIEKLYDVKKIKDLFGFEDNDCIGKLTFPAIQAAPSFSSSFPDFFNRKKNIPCLIPCAIDQDSMFRMAREVAPDIGCTKPAVLHTKFLASLQGKRWKMSASHPDGAIFLTDDESEIKRKIRNCDKSVLFQYLSFFMEDNRRFEQKKQEYESNTLTEADLESELTTVLKTFTEKFRRIRNNINDDRMQKFMSPRK